MEQMWSKLGIDTYIKFLKSLNHDSKNKTT